MCQINQPEGTASFAATRRVLRELFAKNRRGVRSTLQVRGWNQNEAQTGYGGNGGYGCHRMPWEVKLHFTYAAA